MITINDFHKLVGQTIMACQCIELDVKLMYSGMMQGNFERNLAMVRNKALGPVLVELEILDNSDGHPYFSKNDYELLFEIKDIRNYWVHKGYSSFIYLSGDKWQEGLEAQYNKIYAVYKKLSLMANEAQNIRLDVMKKFGRM